MVITKFNFNGLFSKAWVNAVTPANVIVGFKTCGVYPLIVHPLRFKNQKRMIPHQGQAMLVVTLNPAQLLVTVLLKIMLLEVKLC